MLQVITAIRTMIKMFSLSNEIKILQVAYGFELEAAIVLEDWELFYFIFYDVRNWVNRSLGARIMELLLSLEMPPKWRVYGVHVCDLVVTDQIFTLKRIPLTLATSHSYAISTRTKTPSHHSGMSSLIISACYSSSASHHHPRTTPS